MSRRRRSRWPLYESLLWERFRPPRRRRDPHEPDDSPGQQARRRRELTEAVRDVEE